MSKTSSSLRSAIQDLNIQKPLQVRQTRGPEIRGTHSDVPETERPRSETIHGFFMMAHRIFSESAIRDLPGDCFRIFLWMSAQAYRFKTSKGTVRASAKFVSAGVGVAESSVSRSFEALLKAKLIKRVEINYKLGTLWWVDPIAFAGENYERSQGEAAQNETPEIELPHSESGAVPKRATQSPNLSQEVSETGGEIKNLQESKIKDLLSSYFEGVKPERKRVSEWEAFQELQKEFSREDIDRGMAALLNEDPERLKYHSPLAYLSHALPQVLKKAHIHEAATQKRSKYELEKEKQRIQDAEEDRHWAEKEMAFLAAFRESDAQVQAIEHYAGTPIGGVKTGAIRRNIAISRWWDTRQKSDLED